MSRPFSLTPYMTGFEDTTTSPEETFEHENSLMNTFDEESFINTADPDLDGKDGADPDPSISEDGYPTMTPEFDEYDMLATLQDPPRDEPQAILPPEEAYETMKFTAPLSEAEEAIMESTPFINPGPEGAYASKLDFVDDADHDEWMFQNARSKKKSMDNILEDVMYGSRLTEEEKMDLAGSETGAYRRRPVRRMRPRRVSADYDATRDFSKLAAMQTLASQLINEHTLYLRERDLRGGIKKDPSEYAAMAKHWTRNLLRRHGLPVRAGTTQIAENIMGSCMGNWVRPAEWFQQKISNILAQTAPRRLQALSPQAQAFYDGTAPAPGASPPPPPGMAPPPPPPPYGMAPPSYGPAESNYGPAQPGYAPGADNEDAAPAEEEEAEAEASGYGSAYHDGIVGDFTSEDELDEMVEIMGDDDMGKFRIKKMLGKVAHVALTPARVAKSVAKWTGHKLEQAAKAVASAAATPIKRSVRPTVKAAAMARAKKNGRSVPNHADKAAASKATVAALLHSRNPLVKFGGAVLKYVGTGVAGTVDGDMSVMGFTGAEIAALSATAAAAIGAVILSLRPRIIQQVTSGPSDGAPPSDGSAPPEGAPEGAPVDVGPPQEAQPAEEAEAQAEASGYGSQYHDALIGRISFNDDLGDDDLGDAAYDAWIAKARAANPQFYAEQDRKAAEQKAWVEATQKKQRQAQQDYRASQQGKPRHHHRRHHHHRNAPAMPTAADKDNKPKLLKFFLYWAVKAARGDSGLPSDAIREMMAGIAMSFGWEKTSRVYYAPVQAKQGEVMTPLRNVPNDEYVPIDGRPSVQKWIQNHMGDSSLGKLYTSINDPLADFSGDDDLMGLDLSALKQQFEKGKNAGSDHFESDESGSFVGHSGKVVTIVDPAAADQAVTMERDILRQITSKVVSAKLVCDWATSKCKSVGKGRHCRAKLGRAMRRHIEKQGAVLSATKTASEGI